MTPHPPPLTWAKKAPAREQLFQRLNRDPQPDEPLTGFERHFMAKGLPIHRARLRKL